MHGQPNVTFQDGYNWSGQHTLLQGKPVHVETDAAQCVVWIIVLGSLHCAWMHHHNDKDYISTYKTHSEEISFLSFVKNWNMWLSTKSTWLQLICCQEQKCLKPVSVLHCSPHRPSHTLKNKKTHITLFTQINPALPKLCEYRLLINLNPSPVWRLVFEWRAIYLVKLSLTNHTSKRIQCYLKNVKLSINRLQFQITSAKPHLWLGLCPLIPWWPIELGICSKHLRKQNVCKLRLYKVSDIFGLKHFLLRRQNWESWDFWMSSSESAKNVFIIN